MLKRSSVFIILLLLFFMIQAEAYGAPGILGRSGVLIDAQSGQILFEQNKDEKLPPASTTKMLTAIMAIESGKLDDIVTIGANPPKAEGTSVYLQEDEKISLRTLVQAALVHSANDAAVAIAEYLGGSEAHFVVMMNEKARAIGATNSNFVNSHGLTVDGHTTTAYDLALIGNYAMKNEEFKKIVQQKILDWSGLAWQARLINKNEILWSYKGADGIKTGYTKDAKNTIVASATKSGRSYIAVVLGSSGNAIWSDAENLLDYGFTEFKQVTLAKQGEVKALLKIDENRELQLVTKQDFGVSLPNIGDINTIQSRVVFEQTGDKIEAGETVGHIIYQLDGKDVGEFELVAANSVSKPWEPLVIATCVFSGIFFLQILWRIYQRARRKQRRSANIFPKY